MGQHIPVPPSVHKTIFFGFFNGISLTSLVVAMAITGQLLLLIPIGLNACFWGFAIQDSRRADRVTLHNYRQIQKLLEKE